MIVLTIIRSLGWVVPLLIAVVLLPRATSDSLAIRLKEVIDLSWLEGRLAGKMGHIVEVFIASSVT